MACDYLGQVTALPPKGWSELGGVIETAIAGETGQVGHTIAVIVAAPRLPQPV